MIDSTNDTNIEANNDENQMNDLERNDTGSDSKRFNKRKQSFERKNIRNIIDDQKFGKDAKDAQKAEYERLKRVQEKEQNVRVHNIISNDAQVSANHIFQPSNFNQTSIPNNILKMYSSLQPDTTIRYKRNNYSGKHYRMVPDNCVIFLDESDEEHERRQSDNKVEVIEISDGEDDDDNIEDNIDQEQADINNFDRDAFGNILINVAHSKEEDDFFLSEKISNFIKPHQVSGIRFLYENLVESKKQFKEADGFGCILAHSMGLGKTIQIIGFLDILFRCCDAKSTLVIVPINTLQNWQAEIENWLPTNETSSSTNSLESIGSVKKEHSTNQRSFRMFVIKDCHKTIESRHSVIKDWMLQGGVMLIGYEMFRLLVTYRQNKIVKPKKKDRDAVVTPLKKKVFIDAELEERRNSIYQDFLKALVNPGPEVIICDEGHRIKNSEASISKALKAVRTHRRVVMTGYPLQNNLTEYWCMVDFVRPNYLGSKHEFNNMFQRPIENGQCVDSTVEDRKLMQGRAHVLHELLQGFVQRRSHAVLKANLPPKWEYVIMIKMSPIQRKLYSSFMEQLFSGNLYSWSQNSTLKIYAMCCKIWNHPDILFRVLQEKMLSRSDPDFDFDIDEEVHSTPRPSSSRARPKPREGEEDAGRAPAGTMSYSAYLEMLTRKTAEACDSPYSWISEDSWRVNDTEEYTPGRSENSGKILLFLSLLEDCILFGDRMLVFSQSLLTLDIIELFLRQSRVSETVPWEKNRTYFRLDGSTSASERERMINSFNDADSCAHLFLLSTRAGCLGINLVGANRVVVFDASWNPCHDCQAVCRVYRYGQRKPCFIYRLVSDRTMERKIYDRQVAKQGISDRVVDESNPGQHFLRSQVQVLLEHEQEHGDCSSEPGLSRAQVAAVSTGCGEEDPVLGRALRKHAAWVTRVPFTHESLLIDRKDYRLTKREKRKAKESYERDKRQSLYYQKNSYADLYTKSVVPVVGDGYGIPSRPPIPPYRSSIIPNLSNIPSVTPNFSSIYNNRFKINKNVIRPPIMSKTNSALMREIVEAQLRCGYNQNAPFPIAVSDDEDDLIVVRKKLKENSSSDINVSRRQRDTSNRVTDYPADDVSQRSVSLKTPIENDTSSEHRTDSNFKVIKITATTDLTFPATPSIVTSQACTTSSGTATGTKICSGEPLEVIYTDKGKFLRVPRTGDLFAIKDNKDRPSAPAKSSLDKPRLYDNTNHNNQSPSSFALLPDTSVKNLSSSSSSSSCSSSSSLATVIDQSLCQSNSNDQSNKIGHPSCCNCTKQSTGSCGCPCHPGPTVSLTSTTSPSSSNLPAAVVFPSTVYQPHLLFDQRPQMPQFAMMNPPFLFDGRGSLISLISTPVVVTNGSKNFTGNINSTSLLPEEFRGSSAARFSGFEFSNL